MSAFLYPDSKTRKMFGLQGRLMNRRNEKIANQILQQKREERLTKEKEIYELALKKANRSWWIKLIDWIKHFL